jgi:hypothetical protein
MRIVRWWLLNREQARQVARQHVELRGLPWTEPVVVRRGLLGGWNVVTHSGHRGGNVYMHITRRGTVSGGLGVTPR